MFIYLYNGSRSEVINFKALKIYLKKLFKKSQIKLRGDFIRHYLAKKEGRINSLAEELARIKVRNLERNNLFFTPNSLYRKLNFNFRYNRRGNWWIVGNPPRGDSGPLTQSVKGECQRGEAPMDKIAPNVVRPILAEIEYEKNKILNAENKSAGILYDGLALKAIFSTLIPQEESGLKHLHIVFTNQLVATFDEDDLRYHLRASIYGSPSIISTSGIVEAPAKPKEFYLKERLGIDRALLKEEFRGRFIDYEDKRLTEVIKGYILQAIFYRLTGEPFCENKKCRLFNAHWQEELIQAQIKNKKELCPKHLSFTNLFG